MNMKNKFWKYLTVFFVVLVMLNPEMIQLAFFIDAIGLEMFLMLIEVQLLSVLTMLFNTKIKPVYTYFMKLYALYFMENSEKSLKEIPTSLIISISAPAVLMQMLVFITAFDIVIN